MNRNTLIQQLRTLSVDDLSAQLNALQRHQKAAAILVIFYIVGILGIYFAVHPKFILLTPFTLLLSIGTLLWAQEERSMQLWIYLVIAAIIGFAVECYGVNTGLLFGEYKYGPVLGPKVYNTPLMIAVNWAMLTYASGAVMNASFPKLHFSLKTSLAAAIMLSLDVLIEPVAILYDFWSWKDNIIPLQNYIAWYGISWVLMALFFILNPNLRNKTAFVLLILQFLFFWILNFK